MDKFTDFFNMKQRVIIPANFKTNIQIKTDSGIRVRYIDKYVIGMKRKSKPERIMV